MPRDATVVMLTGHGDIETAVEAMKLGAENFLTKPVELPHLAAAAERALEKTELRRANRSLAGRLAEGATPPRWAGRRGCARSRGRWNCSPPPRERRAPAGRERHRQGVGRADAARPLAARRAPVRGGQLRRALRQFLDSELFGHEKGAFTDAKTMKRGLFEVAHGGTLFLDEMGDLAPDLQPKLLKVLERKTFRRLGGDPRDRGGRAPGGRHQPRPGGRVAAGRFREDLFYRLNVLPLTLPPVRERSREDLLELVHRLMGDLRAVHPRGAPTASPTRRSSCCWRTAGRATSASCATCWSGAGAFPGRGGRSSPSTSRPRCAPPRPPRRRCASTSPS